MQLESKSRPTKRSRLSKQRWQTIKSELARGRGISCALTMRGLSFFGLLSWPDAMVSRDSLSFLE